MSKKVLITGISGMVGSHLAEFIFNNTNWEIFGMIRWRSPLDNLQNLIQNINSKNRISLVYGDLIDSISINNVIKSTKPDYIFHLAAQSFPLASFSLPLETFNVNGQGTLRLLESIRNHSKDSIVHVCSSSEVFGKVPKEKTPINEECTFHPASPYAISKVNTDLIARFYAEAYNINIQTTRMFTHTGPRRGDIFAESSFAKQIAMIEEGLIDNKIYVGNLNSLRTIADVRDAVKAYYLLLTKNPIKGGYYNIGGNYSCKVEDILNYLLSLTSIKSKIEIIQDEERMRPIDADLQIPDTTKFYNHTGWKPEITFEKTMKDLLEYWRKKIKENHYKYLVR